MGKGKEVVYGFLRSWSEKTIDGHIASAPVSERGESQDPFALEPQAFEQPLRRNILDLGEGDNTGAA
jgi:hypothetical protein